MTEQNDSEDAGRWRWRAELASALLFALAGGTAAVLALLVLVDGVSPNISVPHQPTALEVLVVIPALLVVSMIGLLAGSVLFILVWAPFSTQRQLERFAQPDIPPFSTVLRWVIRKVAR